MLPFIDIPDVYQISLGFAIVKDDLIQTSALYSQTVLKGHTAKKLSKTSVEYNKNDQLSA